MTGPKDSLLDALKLARQYVKATHGALAGAVGDDNLVSPDLTVIDAAISNAEKRARMPRDDGSDYELLLKRAAKEPLGVDISDYSDEWCAGFLQGQVNSLEYASGQTYRTIDLGLLEPLQPLIEELRGKVRPGMGIYGAAASSEGDEVYVFGIDAANREYAMRFTPEELQRMLSQLGTLIKTMLPGSQQ